MAFLLQANLSKLSPDELKKRQEFLRTQRDKLLAMKKQAREKQLGVASEAQPTRPQSARVARDAMSSQTAKQSTDIDNDEKMQMRRAIADRLKKEVIGSKQ